jgi:hypothetical protein
MLMCELIENNKRRKKNYNNNKKQKTNWNSLFLFHKLD